MRTQWSVAVFYEHPLLRPAAVQFCDGLVERFWEEYNFEVTWWSFAQVLSGPSRQAAAAKAAEADLILFMVRAGKDVPLPVKAWIETWLGGRGDREGIVVGLQSPPADETARLGDALLHLRGVAHRAGMDFLTELPQSLAHPLPENLDSFSARANQITHVLDLCLQPPPRPRFRR